MSEKRIKITSGYWIIQRCGDELVYTSFDNALTMDNAIDDIVVSAGEQGYNHNIIAQHPTQEILNADVKSERAYNEMEGVTNE